jgi:hypothetical protein
MFFPAPARKIALWVAIPFCSLTFISCGGTDSSRRFANSASPSPESIPGHHIKNVFLIMMENHNWTGDGPSEYTRELRGSVYQQDPRTNGLAS